MHLEQPSRSYAAIIHGQEVTVNVYAPNRVVPLAFNGWVVPSRVHYSVDVTAFEPDE